MPAGADTSLIEKHKLVLKAIVSLLEKHKPMKGFEMQVLLMNKNKLYLHWQLSSKHRSGRFYTKGGALYCGNYVSIARIVMAEPDSIDRLAQTICYCALPGDKYPCSVCPGVK